MDSYDIEDGKPDFHMELRRCINENLSAYRVIDKAWARAVTHCCMQSMTATTVWVFTDSYYWSYLIIEALSVIDINKEMPFERAFRQTICALRDRLPLQVDIDHHPSAVVPAVTRVPLVKHDHSAIQKGNLSRKLITLEEVAALIEKNNGNIWATGQEPVRIDHNEIISEGLSDRPLELLTFNFGQLAFFTESLYDSSIYGFHVDNADDGRTADHISNNPLNSAMCGEFATTPLDHHKHPDRVVKWVRAMYEQCQSRSDRPAEACYIIVHSLGGVLQAAARAFLRQPVVLAQPADIKRNWLLASIIEHFHRQRHVYENAAIFHFENTLKVKGDRMSCYLAALVNAFLSAKLSPVKDEMLNDAVLRKFEISLTPAERTMINRTVTAKDKLHYNSFRNLTHVSCESGALSMSLVTQDCFASKAYF